MPVSEGRGTGVIEFLCPNNHKIRCSEEQAGKPAKCPRCGVKFLIPGEAQAGPGSSAGDTSVTSPGPTEAAGLRLAGSSSGGAASSAHPRNKPKEPQIEFLCPNGHHLHGPASLQGHPGECPECGSRFRIPNYDELPTETPVEEEISLDGLDNAPTAEPEAGPSDMPAGSLLPPRVVHRESSAVPPRPAEPATLPLVEPEPISVPTPATRAVPPPPTVHALAELFGILWAARSDGAKVEVHLTGGEVLVPDAFASHLSRQNHGVFAMKAPEGTYTLIAVPWDAVQRVVVAGVKEVERLGMSGS